jgi:hypothetical protein
MYEKIKGANPYAQEKQLYPWGSKFKNTCVDDGWEIEFEKEGSTIVDSDNNLLISTE